MRLSVAAWRVKRPIRYSLPAVILMTAALIATKDVGIPAWALDPQSFTHYKNAVALERAGKLDQAAQELQKAIAFDPYDSLNYVKLASILAQQGQPHEAISIYEQALKVDANDPMIPFSIGALYEQIGDFGKAERAYEKGIQSNPNYPYGLFNLARTQVELKRYPEAIQNYRKFLVAYPEQYDAHRSLAQLYLATRQPKDAAEQYDWLKQHYPAQFADELNYARALNQSDEPQKALAELQQLYAKEGDKGDIAEEMGNAHLKLGQKNFALQNFEKAVSLNPDKQELWIRMGDIQLSDSHPDQAVEDYQKYLSAHPEDGQENLNVRQALIQAYFQQKNYDKAIQQINLILESQTADSANVPLNRDALKKQLAYAYQMKGDTPHAISLYEDLLSRYPGDTQLKTNLAIAYHRAGIFDKAEQLYKQLYNASPTKSPSLANDLANVLTTEGDNQYAAHNLEGAKAKYQDALQYATPDNVVPKLGLANTYYLLAQQNPGPGSVSTTPNMTNDNLMKARSLYQEILDKNPNQLEARLYVSKIDLQLARLHPQLSPNTPSPEVSQVLSRFKALADANPSSFEATVALGDAYLSTGNAESAIPVYETALKFKPKNESLLMALANAQYQAGHLEDAQKSYEAIQDVNPDNAMAHYNLATIYSQKGDLETAEKEYQTVLSLDPNYSDALYGLATTFENEKKYADALSAYKTYTEHNQGGYLKDAQERITLLQRNFPKLKAGKSSESDQPTMRTLPAERTNTPTSQSEPPDTAP